MTVVAALWPDGKLEVDGSEPSLATSGRGRSTRKFTARKIDNSRTSPSASTAMWRQCRPTANTAATTSAIPIAPSVSADSDKNFVTASAPPSRCSDSHLVARCRRRPLGRTAAPW